MNQLLEQFLSEAREFLQSIAEKLLLLEKEPKSTDLIMELFRLVHTLKGNSGLFDLPEMTRVLHASEDLMEAVRSGNVTYSVLLADTLLDAMDFVGMLCDELEANGNIDASHTSESANLSQMLRQLIWDVNNAPVCEEHDHESVLLNEFYRKEVIPKDLVQQLSRVSEPIRLAAFSSAMQGEPLHWLCYTPSEDCFFMGEDPFFQARQTPGLVGGGITPREPWPKLAELDAYRCVLDFHVLSLAPLGELNEFYRYVSDQVEIVTILPRTLIIPQGDLDESPVYVDFVTEALHLLHQGDREGLSLAVQSMQELANPELWISSALRWIVLVMTSGQEDSDEILKVILNSMQSCIPPEWTATKKEPSPAQPSAPVHDQTLCVESQQIPGAGGLLSDAMDVLVTIVAAQREILALPCDVSWLAGRINGVASVLSGCLGIIGREDALSELRKATESAVSQGTAAPVLEWLNRTFPPNTGQQGMPSPTIAGVKPILSPTGKQGVGVGANPARIPSSAQGEVKFGRRAEDSFLGTKILKVDQVKIDRLMNLIGEMVVAKNALPYVSGRAESVYGVRELSREIKTQYAVINRIAEEMQDSIMQVRMMPVSFIFQRFPRLVRDISHRLGKEVNLVLEGEDTEADKNIIEALGDPLVHIVRNSLDHGIEPPDIRRSASKPSAGTLTICATRESDRVIITIKDDGKGINPDFIKQKAYEKGLIDEDRLNRITDQEAINLIFAPGFSTADEVSDLSGRGVGMDVVKSAVEKVNGSLLLESEKNAGTCISLSLPLSMAVTNVMIVASNNQIFGVPMDVVVETVRVPRKDIRSIKNTQTTVLRGRIIPLKSLNFLMGMNTPPMASDEDELAVLVVQHGGEPVGVLVDDFHETVDIILKPMTGVLAGLAAYAGSALLGDGSVLMVLNIKEIL